MSIIINNVMNYYVYLWVDPKTKKPFYVGKGKNKRAYAPHQNQRAYNKYKKLILEGFKPIDIVTIILDKLSEQDALQHELEIINKYKRLEDGGVLFNYSLKNYPSHFKMIDPNVLQNIIVDYTTTNLSAYKIGKKYNIHETTCLRWLKQNNIPIYSKGNRRNVNKQQIKKILLFAKQGMIPIEITKQCNLTLAIVSRLLKQHGIETHSKVLKRKKITENPNNVAEIIKLYQQRCGLLEIANKFGTSTVWVRRILKENNIKIRRTRWCN
jgi:transposase